MKLLFMIISMTVAINLQQKDLPKLIPGAIVNYKGKLKLIDNYISVVIDISDLLDVPPNLIKIGSKLNSVAHDVQVLKKMYNIVGDQTLLIDQINKTLLSTVAQIKVTLSYFPTEKSEKSKRGLANIVGSGLHYLFGTATDADVAALHERITSLQDEKQKNDKILELLLSSSKKRNNKINELIRYSSNLSKQVFEVSDINSKLLYVSHLSLHIDQQIKSLVTFLQDNINAITLALNGIITTNLISLTELKSVFPQAFSLYNLLPLFSENDYYLYYSYMDAQIAPSRLIIHIPMSSTFTFHHFQIIPFPTFYHGKTVTLHINQTNIFISDNLEYYMQTTVDDLQGCTEHEKFMICRSNMLPWQRYTEVSTCQSYLFRENFITISELPLRCNVSKTNDVLNLKVVYPYLFVSKPDNNSVLVKCHGNSQVVQKRTFKLLSSCSVIGSNFSITGVSENYINISKPKFKLDFDPLNWTMPINLNITSVIKPLPDMPQDFTFLENSSSKFIFPTFSLTAIVLSMITLVIIGVAYWKFIKKTYY